MAIKVITHWPEIVEKGGEVDHITEKEDWNLEIGAITQETYRIGGPALLFENIKQQFFCPFLLLPEQFFLQSLLGLQ